MKRFYSEKQILAVTSERDSLLRRLEEVTPRIWTAETIGDAPEGDYRCQYDGNWSQNGTRPLWDIKHEIAMAIKRDDEGKRPVSKLPESYFGPMPLPPSPGKLG